MIALLTGQFVHLDDTSCIIDVAGVGYLVQASTRTIAALPRPPAMARVLVETIVREDAILLFAFAEAAERDWFRLLLTIQGVGARVALAILGALSPQDLVQALTTGDRAAISRAPGVGPKLAVRLLTELRDRAATMPTSAAVPPFARPAPGGIAADALSALANLGYRRAEAAPVLDRVMQAAAPDAGLDAILRQCLRELAR